MMKGRGMGIFLSYGYTFLNMVCSLVMSSFLLRSLGDIEYGLYQTISAFATYLVMLEFGTGTVMTRNVSLCRGKNDAEGLKKNVSTIWYTTVFLATFIVLVSVIFCLNIGNIYSESMTAAQVRYGQKMFLVMTGYLVVSFFTNNLNGLLLGIEDYTFGNILRIVRVAVRTLLLLVLVSLKPEGMIIALVDLFVSLAVFIYTYFFCKKRHKIKFRFKDFEWTIVKESLPLCLALLLQSVINQANTSIGKFIIGIKLSLASVSLYSIVQYIYSTISSVATVPISMYMPQIAKDVAGGKRGKELTATLIPACRLVVIICGTLIFGFIAFGKPFIGIVYGVSKQEAWIYAVISCVPMFVNMTNGVIINLLDLFNKRLMRSLVLIGTTVINVSVTLLLISRYGVLGVVLGTAISLILGNIIIMNAYYKVSLKINVMWLFGQAYKGLLPSQIIACVVGFFLSRLFENLYLSLLAGGGGFAVVLLACMLIFGLNKQEKAVVFRKLRLKGKAKE